MRLLTLTLLFLRIVSASIGPTADLHIVNNNIQPDGFTRSAVLAGTSSTVGTFPGPLISGAKGTTFFMNVVNHLTDTTMLTTTSIHWHGMFQHRTSWADGPIGVTQCPITPGDSFLYQFSVPDQAGTFWYHSHHSAQYCDGLRGPLVIYDKLDPNRALYDIDDETTVITLADWYHTPSPQLNSFPTPDATLINGKGRYSGGPAAPLSNITVVQGKRYRFRLVSMSCLPNYVFSIDGHTMNIIEVDGISVTPTTVDSIQIFAGQRYSFVLTASQPTDNYWIRALPNVGTPGFNGGINSAILQYAGAPNQDPTSTQTASVMPMRETDLHPLVNPGAPGPAKPGAADININLNIVFNYTLFKYTLNGAPFDPPTVPVLLQILSGAKTAQEMLPPGSVYVLPRDKVVEVTMPAVALAIGGPHPLHLHGNTFDVIRSAGSSTYNFVNPVRRDVVSIGQNGDNVTIRFTTNNAGPWFLHCHIDWHMVLGLGVVFAVDVPTISSTNPPAAWNQLCPTYNGQSAP
ncbi:laccase, multicopper oxidase, benzenediol:oxygen oxidorectuctase [Laccaria bicolor S238N-H82]|uniref:Laccase, multicopper oxidase, benzenediol:oxygen oxidorectuctase n=2 Tax=Laccaria bicolor TaxID=29883 RepID=B0DZT1_LACBS|nr:laccase, multicopper oxidase, benzenediol:oxygen oxidorectuctase [Laccaria bicolor S238N-H82]ACN49096.1 laccase [Laccaria bicolor]EDQ99886.1 laccase, multicopper oxidase, benzenediol:oxygen oxidorectuctase [Laccaria bicolor S238N-H82]|eukprot:XP_001889429.1 laccase, multicopper oxidase, benzenediol:oxygen oxidorectuctase [Laccaria bicolor S238N-H82]